MNKDNLRKATEALRSEQYPQTIGALRNSEGYCALGVICDASGLGQWVKVEGNDSCWAYMVGDYAGSALAPAVQEWLGTEADPFLAVQTPDGWTTDVMDLNDDLQVPFHEIAAIIEKNFDL